MYRTVYIKYLFGIGTLLLFRLLYWKYSYLPSIPTRIVFELGRFDKYSQLLSLNGELDTYFGRIHQFLHERNVSYFSYERMTTIDGRLLDDIHSQVTHFHQIQQQDLSKIINEEQQIQYGCQQECCWSIRKAKHFYMGENDRSPTYLDRLSQIDFKLLADLHFGYLRLPNGIKLPKLTMDILPCLQNNTVIFVDTLDLQQFFRLFHTKISVDYILLTGDSDISCPRHLSVKHFPLLNKIFAGKTHIKHWFAMNCDLGNNKQWKQSKIFSCLPQGINQWLNQRYFMQLASGKDDSVHNTFLKTNDYWILTSFNVNNGVKYRKTVWELSCYGRLRNISKCFYGLDSIDQWTYYIHMGRSKFVLSPPGDGMDCYRTWEALYLGSIPIILQSTINSIYEDLPVLIVNSYEELNLELLKNVYENMTKQTYDYRRLYKGYWQKKINDYRNSSEMIHIHYSISKQ